MLDHNLYYTTPFGRFFDKIIFQIDKKYNNQVIFIFYPSKIHKILFSYTFIHSISNGIVRIIRMD